VDALYTVHHLGDPQICSNQSSLNQILAKTFDGIEGQILGVDGSDILSSDLDYARRFCTAGREDRSEVKIMSKENLNVAKKSLTASPPPFPPPSEGEGWGGGVKGTGGEVQ